MPGGIIGAADEVVEGNVEVVREGDEDGRGGENFSVFVGLIHTLGNPRNFGGLLLSYFVGFTESL